MVKAAVAAAVPRNLWRFGLSSGVIRGHPTGKRAPVQGGYFNALRFRHWGSLARPERCRNGGRSEKQSGRSRALQVGRDAPSGRWRAAGVGQVDWIGTPPGNGIPLHYNYRGIGLWPARDEWWTAFDYGERAVSSREYCSRSMRLSFSRNLPRTGSA